MNLNMLFDKLTNFKIKFTKDPSPVEVSNLPLTFIAKGVGSMHYYECDFKSIELGPNKDVVEIILE